MLKIKKNKMLSYQFKIIIRHKSKVCAADLYVLKIYFYNFI